MDRGFLSAYRYSFIAPRACYRSLLLHRLRLRFGFTAVLIQALLYTLVYVFLTIGNGRPFKPWLRIPDEAYYSYNVYFLAPSMVLAWLLSAATVHAVCRAGGLRGVFDDLLALFGMGIGVASYATLPHDLVTSALGAAGVINQQHYESLLNGPTVWRALLLVQMALYVAWFVFLFSTAISLVYRTRAALAVPLGLLAFLVYQGFFFVFNR